MFSKTTLATLLALSPALCLAQSTSGPYIGASASLLWTTPFSSYSTTHVGPALTLGMQFSPQWALEFNPQLFWDKESSYESYPLYYNNLDYNIYYESRYTVFTLPVLARYSFTAPEAALQVDALGGATWLHSSGSSSITSTYSSGTSTTQEYKSSNDNLALTLGPQVRYSLNPALALKLSVPFNVVVTGDYDNFGDRLFLTPQLGVQYSFAH